MWKMRALLTLGRRSGSTLSGAQSSARCTLGTASRLRRPKPHVQPILKKSTVQADHPHKPRGAPPCSCVEDAAPARSKRSAGRLTAFRRHGAGHLRDVLFAARCRAVLWCALYKIHVLESQGKLHLGGNCCRSPSRGRSQRGCRGGPQNRAAAPPPLPHATPGPPLRRERQPTDSISARSASMASSHATRCRR